MHPNVSNSNILQPSPTQLTPKSGFLVNNLVLFEPAGRTLYIHFILNYTYYNIGKILLWLKADKQKRRGRWLIKLRSHVQVAAVKLIEFIVTHLLNARMNDSLTD